MSFLFSQPAPGILPANSVDFSEVETIGANTLLGNNTGADSVIQELSVASVSTMLNLSQYLTSVSGTAPIVSSGGTTPVISINNFGGATALLPGSKGSVPAPAAGDQNKYLRGDATWAIVDLSTKANTDLSNLTNPTALNQVLRAPNGSASAPSYSFTNNIDAGMYRSAGDGIAFAARGSAKMEITYRTDIYGDLVVSGQIYCLSNAINAQTVTATSNFRMNTDKEGYQTYPNGIGIGWVNELLRPSYVNACSWIRVGKKINSTLTYGGALAVTAPDDIQIENTLTSSVNNSTTITFSGVGIPINYINIGDYIQLNGLSAVGKVLARTSTSPLTFTVDTPLGDGTPRTVRVKQDTFSVRKNDGSPALEINYQGVLKSSGGEQHASIHNQAGTANVITASINDYYIGVDTSSAAKTVNLPAAATAGQGFVLVIKDESGNAATAGRNITIDANGSETIDGALTQVINTNYGSASLMCSGSAWFLM